MKELFKELEYWLEGKVKEIIGEITPDKQLAVTLIILLVFTLANLYLTFSSVYNLGKSNAEKSLKMKYIEQLRLQRSPDSLLYDFNQHQQKPESDENKE